MSQVTHLDCHSTATSTTLHSILLNTLHKPCKTDIDILIINQIAIMKSKLVTARNHFYVTKSLMNAHIL